MFSLYSLLKGLISLFKSPTYGETIERYVRSQHPKDTSDIERLTIEWHRGQSKERFL